MSDSEDNNSAEENSDISGNEEVAAVEVEPIEGGLEEDDDDEGADVTWEDLVRFEFAWSTTTHVVLTFRDQFSHCRHFSLSPGPERCYL